MSGFNLIVSGSLVKGDFTYNHIPLLCCFYLRIISLYTASFITDNSNKRKEQYFIL